jgi:TRAP-type mannitol/chloroaromatic compound transport system permease large subunit
VAPPLSEEESRIPVPAWQRELARLYSPNMLVAFARALVSPVRALGIDADGARLAYGKLASGFATALIPLALAAVNIGIVHWYVTVHRPAQAAEDSAAGPAELERLGTEEAVVAGASADPAVPDAYPAALGAAVAAIALLLFVYYRRFGPERFTLLSMLASSVMPLATLTVLVLLVILLGITTATESAAVGAAGAFLLAWGAGTLSWKRTKEAMFLTAKTTAMVCWLFVGSALFSAVFALHGGQLLIERWVVAMDLTPVQFMILSQAIIFVLGWPLEWTEIVVIFVPIFLPLLAHFHIDPVLWGTLVFVNLQAAFLSPPIAMSAYYLKGVAPPHVTLNQIFAGMAPYMGIVILCMVLLYLWPGFVMWLPEYLYGK